MAHELHRLLARNLKSIRAQRGLTQDSLAEMAGISKNYLAEIETGRKYPSPDTFVALASALEVPPFRLIMEDLPELLARSRQRGDGAAVRDMLARELLATIDKYFYPGADARKD